MFSSPEGPGTGTLELAVGSSSEGIGTLDTTDPGKLELGLSGNLELTATTTGTLRTLVFARLLLTGQVDSFDDSCKRLKTLNDLKII